MQIQIITTPDGIREIVDSALDASIQKHLHILGLQKNYEKEKDLTIEQAYKDLQISRATLNTLMRTKQIEYYKIGRSVRIPLAAIEKFKEAQKGAC